jgi:hypothetical protein
MRMKILGLLLVLAGAAMFLLPKVGVTIPASFDPVMKFHPPWVGIGAIALGLLLFAMAPKKAAKKP